MLYDPQWDKKPSVAGFRHWLQQQDPHKPFRYVSCDKCAVGQYLASLELYWHEVETEAKALNRYALIAAIRHPSRPTFGDVLQAMDEFGDVEDVLEFALRKYGLRFCLGRAAYPTAAAPIVEREAA